MKIISKIGIITIIAALAVVIYVFGLGIFAKVTVKDCGTDMYDCFIWEMYNCSPAKVLEEGKLVDFEYEIIGIQGEYCVTLTTAEAIKNRTYVMQNDSNNSILINFSELNIGDSATCKVPLKWISTYGPSIDNVYAFCKGRLYEHFCKPSKICEGLYKDFCASNLTNICSAKEDTS